MIQILARPANNQNNFVDKRKKNILSADTSQILPWLATDFGFYWVNLSSFGICFNALELISFWQNITISDLRENLTWIKTANLCQNADDSQSTNNFPNPNDLLRTEKRYVGRTAVEHGRQSSWFVHWEMNHYTPCLR